MTAIAWLSCPTTGDARTPEQSNCVVTDAMTSESGAAYIRSVRYSDALGFPLMTATSHGQRDILTMQRRDGRGLTTRRYLPTPSAPNNNCSPLSEGDYLELAKQFHADTVPFTDVTYEWGPTARPLSEQRPGQKWARRDISCEYLLNLPSTDSGSASDYQLTCLEMTVDLATDEFRINRFYPEATLRVVRQADEDGHTSLVFTDNQGRTVMERKVLTLTGLFADTHYVYDMYGDLRYVVSPEGSRHMGVGGGGSYLARVLHDYCWRYGYDGDHRLVSAAAPGCDATLYVYDRLDQLMMSQDPIQRASDQWTVIKRDLKRRPAVVGKAKITGATRGSLQALYGDTMLYESRLAAFDKSTMGYTSSSGPTGFTPHSATFYDDYSFYPGSLPLPPNGFSLNDRHPGTSLPTGWACGDADGNAYVGATFYDKKGRPILSVEQDADGRIYRLEQWAKNSFRGLVTDRRVSVTDIARQEGHAVTYKYLYDDAEQLVSTKMSVDADGELTLSTMGYDGIGRLASKRVGSVDVAYGYDARSHLISIESAPYTQRAYHGISPAGPWKESFNGNIVAQSDSLGIPGETPELTLFKYDHAGRLVQSVPADTSAVGAMAENFEWDCNSNPTYIQRMWNNAAVQDAAVSYQGNRMTGVNDVSDDTYMGSVPQFPGGSYAMTYDASGRLTSDGTRSIKKVTYHDWGDLPRHISFTGGGSVVSNYRADGALMERREYEPLFIAATLGLTAFDKEPVTPGIGGGEIAGNMVGRRRYFGPWEHVDGSGWLLHTPEGVYDLGRHEHHWHLRDRLGSVRAVVDRSGAVVQATRYFASGVPVRVDVAGGRRVSDRGHIGNRWVAHAGLDWYDNTARMHDPLLARFTTMDPKHGDYTQYSPYSHCAGNPVNHTDPTGMVLRIAGKNTEYVYNPDDNTYQGEDIALEDLEFYKKAKDALDEIRKYKIGKSLTDRLISSNNEFVIKRDTKSGFKPTNLYKAYIIMYMNDNSLSQESKDQIASKEELHTGSGGVISWNPDGTNVMTQKGLTFNPLAGLVHEMIHGADADAGLLDATPVNPEAEIDLQVSRSEWQAVFGENHFRKAIGLPYRVSYKYDEHTIKPNKPYLIKKSGPILPEWYNPPFHIK